MKRRTFSREFKFDAANLIIEKDYSYREAQEATGVNNGALRNGVSQLQKKQCETPMILIK